MKHTFYKEYSGTWYIDLPEFLEKGLGTKANLMMVAGADTFLDYISKLGNRIEVTIETQPFEGYKHELVKIGMGKDQAVLDAVGHAPVDYGAYYKTTEEDHVLWLCPVTEYVFGGSYPDKIYITY